MMRTLGADNVIDYTKEDFTKNGQHMAACKSNKDLNYIVELFEAGKLRPVIDKCFPLNETADAFRYFGEGRFKGKIVVTLDHNNGT